MLKPLEHFENSLKKFKRHRGERVCRPRLSLPNIIDAPEVLVHIGANLSASPGDDGEVILWNTHNLKVKVEKIPEKEARGKQAQWLREFKEQAIQLNLPWKDVLKYLGIKQRTWDGWMHRNLPFHKMAKLLHLLKMLKLASRNKG